jgi:hypothetical protein
MIEIKKCDSSGYNRVVEYDKWTVANLATCPDTYLEKIDSFQKHFETDEVFVLLKGSAMLFILESDEFNIEKLKTYKLEPNKVYNVCKNTYHQHILGDDSNVLIIENSNTSDDLNSKRLYLDDQEIKFFRDYVRSVMNV